MISAIGPVGKSDEPVMPVMKPATEAVRTEQVKVSQAASAAIAPPAPLHLTGEDSDIDDFIYTNTVKAITVAAGPGSVDIPGVAVFPGLVGEGFSDSEVKYEMKMGGVVVARIYENGTAMTAPGFDLSKLGFPASEEAEMTGAEMADFRLARLSSYFSTLDTPFDIFDKAGNRVTLDEQNRPVIAGSSHDAEDAALEG